MTMSINHHREGSGPPLVLLHGIGHNWQAWRPVIGLLAREFEVIACDSPGFGHSSQLPSSIRPTITAYVDAFEWFFVELGLERPHVAGNSMGGAIALELARRKAVRSATALSPAGFWTPLERRFAQASLRPIPSMPRALRPAFAALARRPGARRVLFAQLFAYPDRVPADDAVFSLEAAWAAPAFLGALDAFDEYTFVEPEELRSVPVTVAWGRHDRLLIYRTQAPRARAMLPWASHVTLGAGHVPFYDDPAAVAEVIRARAASAPAPGRDRLTQAQKP
jgi:pimeloyl-ACP methyl ester carboxylesterase